VAVLSCGALAGSRGEPEAAQRRPPVSLEELAQQGAATLNGRRRGEFKRLAGPGVDTGWVRNLPTEADPTNPWVAGTLDVRGVHWVVFSLDKMVEMDHDHLYRAERRGGRWLLTASVDEAEPGRHWRIAGHEERVSIDPQSRTARFTDTFSVRALGRGWPLVFDLGYLYEIDRLESAGHSLPYRRAGNLIQVQAHVESGESIRVLYHRTFRQPPGPHSNVTGEDALFWADWLPVIAYQPAPSRITIEAPAAWESLAQGDLALTQRQWERIARMFVNRAPVSFIMAVAGRYTVRRRTAHGYPLATYAKAMSLPWDLNGGGLLALMSTAWVVRDGRILAWSDAGTKDHRALLLTPKRRSTDRTARVWAPTRRPSQQQPSGSSAPVASRLQVVHHGTLQRRPLR
jgi:hypothetical protein